MDMELQIGIIKHGTGGNGSAPIWMVELAADSEILEYLRDDRKFTRPRLHATGSLAQGLTIKMGDEQDPGSFITKRTLEQPAYFALFGWRRLGAKKSPHRRISASFHMEREGDTPIIKIDPIPELAAEPEPAKPELQAAPPIKRVEPPDFDIKEITEIEEITEPSTEGIAEIKAAIEMLNTVMEAVGSGIKLRIEDNRVKAARTRIILEDL